MAEWAQFRMDASKHVSRKAGQSAIAAAAYRAGERLADARTGEVHDYTRRYGVVHAEVVMPESGGPAWSREQLWNAAEAAERRKDARIARKVEMALPADMSDAQRLTLARAWAHELADRFGVAVDFAIHRPDREGDKRNHHMHVLMTTRQVDRDGLTEKAALELSNGDQKKRGLPVADDAIKALRRAMAERLDQVCSDAGIPLSADPRSYAARGIELEPTKHIGVHAKAMERRGLAAERVTEQADVRADNAEQIRQHPEVVLDRLARQRGGFTRADMARELNRYIDDPQEFQVLLARLEQSREVVQVSPQKIGAGGLVEKPAVYATLERLKRVKQAQERAERREALKANYRAYRAGWYAQRKPQREADKARFQAITAKARTARAAVRQADLSVGERKARLSVIAAEAVQAREALRAEVAERRKARPDDWRSWVTAQAEAGDGAAISQLRGWAYRDRRRARQIEREAAEAAERHGGLGAAEHGVFDPAAPAEAVALSPALRMTWLVDSQTGTVTYQVDGKAAFTDYGRRVSMDVDGQHSDDAMEAAMRLAMQKFGPELEVRGSDSFRRRTVEVAVARGIRVRWSDEQMTAYQAQLLGRLRKSYRQATAAPAAAETLGGLRTLSSLDAMKAMGHPGEAKGDVEHGPAGRSGPQRREEHGHGGRVEGDPLAHWRAAAADAKGELDQQLKRAELEVAAELLAAGKPPAHHAAAISAEAQRRVRERLQDQGKTVSARPAASRVSDKDLADTMRQLRSAANKRRIRADGWSDRGRTWRKLSPDVQGVIDELAKGKAEGQADAVEAALRSKLQTTPAAFDTLRKELRRSRHEHGLGR